MTNRAETARAVYRVDLQAVLDGYDKRRRRSKQKRPGASDVGMCRRRTAYKLLGQPVDNHRYKGAAIQGTIKHLVILPMLRTAHGGQIEVRVLDRERGLEGSLDWIRQNPLGWWIVADLKTYSGKVYDYRVSRPIQRYVLYQIHLYADLVRRGLIHPAEKRWPHEPLEVVHLEIIEYCRDDGRTNTRMIPYDPEITAEAWAWLEDVKTQVERDKTAAWVPRDLPGPDVTEICAGCPFAGACWGWDPDSETRQPLALDDTEVQDWLEKYHDAALTLARAKKRQEVARAHLDGLEAKTLATGWKLAWTGGNTKFDEVLDTQAAVEKFEAAGIPVPMRTVEKTTRRAISVTPPARQK